jgi:hypothetical protein
MGLDITAHRQLTELPNGDLEFYVNPDFPGREGQVKSDCAYKAEDSQHVISRSYSGYGVLREILARISGWQAIPYTSYYGEESLRHAASAWAAKEGPFWEIIHFSDCEGTIGAPACAKLLGDFEKFAEAAEKEHPHFSSFYKELWEGVRMAADSGALEFS